MRWLTDLRKSIYLLCHVRCASAFRISSNVRDLGSNSRRRPGISLLAVSLVHENILPRLRGKISDYVLEWDAYSRQKECSEHLRVIDRTRNSAELLIWTSRPRIYKARKYCGLCNFTICGIIQLRIVGSYFPQVYFFFNSVECLLLPSTYLFREYFWSRGNYFY